jgi:hypothetical protein
VRGNTHERSSCATPQHYAEHSKKTPEFWELLEIVIFGSFQRHA